MIFTEKPITITTTTAEMVKNSKHDKNHQSYVAV